MSHHRCCSNSARAEWIRTRCAEIQGHKTIPSRDQLLLAIEPKEICDIIEVVIIRPYRFIFSLVPNLRMMRLSTLSARPSSTKLTLMTPSSSPVANKWSVRTLIRLIEALKDKVELLSIIYSRNDNLLVASDSFVRHLA